MINKKLLLIIVFGLAAFLTAQKRLYFEHISIPQGLSNPSVNDITQDNEGFMWFATAGGLNRYDGYNFKLYKNDPTDSTSLPNDNVFCLLFDSDNNLWVGGREYIVKYNRNTDDFTKYPFERAGNSNLFLPSKIFEDSQKRIWFGSETFGVQLLDKKTNQFKLIKKREKQTSYPWGNVSAFTETETKEILVADTRDGIYSYNETIGLFELLKLPKGESIKNPISLTTDDYGRIWIGQRQGVIKILDQVSNKLDDLNIYKGLKNLGYYGVYNFLKDDKGFIWSVDNAKGLFKINPVNNKFSRSKSNALIENSLNSNNLFTLYQDKFGIIWIGTRSQGINKLNPGKEPLSVYRLPSDYKTNTNSDVISSLTSKNQSISNGEKILWFGTFGNGLFRLNRTKNKIQNFTKSSKGKYKLSSNLIYSLAQDNSNNVWVGTNKGLDKLELKTGIIKSYLQNDLDLNAVVNGIRNIEIDNTGSIWLATSHGVDIFLPQSETVKRVPTIANRRYDKNIMQKIKTLIKNKKPLAAFLKVGEQQNLSDKIKLDKTTNILVINGGEGRVSVENSFDYGWIEDANGKMIWGVSRTDSTFYLGGGLKNRLKIGVLKLQPGEYKLRFISDQGHSYGNWNVRVPKDSLLWGIQAIKISDSEYQTFTKLLKIEDKRKNYMKLEATLSIKFSNRYENIVWLGSVSKGLFKYNYRTGKFNQYLPVPNNEASPKNSIGYILEDSYGLVWFATNGGLGKLDPNTEKIKFFTQKDGLPTNQIRSIQEDNYRNIWISTASGLSKYVRNNADDLGTFINYGTKDGLQAYSFTPASYKAIDGELFFGGTNGINTFYPGKINSVPPSLVITDFKLSSKSVKKDSSNLSFGKDINQLKEITLSHSQNNISFDFASIHYASPEKNKIAYMLEGYNDDWIYDNRRFAAFTNLDPGEYIFKIKGSNGDGIWNKKEKAIKISILPPWWRTWWAYTLFALIFAGILYLVRKVELTRRLKEAELKEAGLRAQIAEAENERKSKELEEARQLQLSMLPKELPNIPNLDIAVYMQTATEVGGDYYDFHVGMDGTLTVVIGDATGHGLNAGTIVTATKSLFNSYAPNPDILFTFSEISRCIKGMKFKRLSMCLSLLKIEGNNLKMSAAGMPPALIYRESKKELEEIMLKGMPLGTTDKFPYELSETTLGSGDTILLSSDGFPELFNDKKEMFGYDRVKETFSSVADRSSEKIIEHLKDTASNWSGGKDPDDDVTFVVLKMK